MQLNSKRASFYLALMRNPSPVPLEDAGAAGTIGPDLDELQPDADRIRKTMMEGMGAMPSFADSLEESEREAIIQYVLHATK